MKRWLWRGCAVAVGLLGLNCTDSTGPRSFAGRLAFAPSFVSSTAGIVDFDRACITVVQAAAPNAQVLDTIIAIPPTADSIDLSLSVPLSSSKEDVLLYLRLVNAAGDTVFKNSPYPQQVTVTSGGAPAVVPAPIVYVGVGYDAVAVTIATPDTSVLFGDTLGLAATAWNAQDQAIPGTPIAWRSLDSVRVKVPNAAAAKVVGGSQRGPAKIIAELLTGQTDTITVTAVALPTTLVRVSGDGQTAPPLAALPLPLRVRVLGSDGLGVRVPVLFRPLTSGASVSADTVVSDSLGYAEVTGTLGPVVGAQGFDARVTGIATPVTFSATAVSGTVASVTLDRTVDTIARGTGLQYNAVARDAQGNPVAVTIGWTATVPAVASINTTGLVVGVAPGFSEIIATAAGHADTALLYVRALDSVVVSPSDTVITAIGDSFDLHATAYDNFGNVLTTGFARKFISTTPTVVTVNQATGRTLAVGAGNGVVIVRDSVDPTLKVQAAATVRVNQVTASIKNTPALPDSLQVGVNGRRAILAQALDRNNYPIPNKTFGFRSADPAVATVDAAGIVTGLQLNGTTFVIDSVDGFKDSVKVTVVAAPPALLQWGYDSLAVGNGGNVSVPLTLSRTDPSPVVIFLSSSDSMLARSATGCPGGSLKRIQIPQNTSATSVLVCGLAAGRVTLVAQDSAGVFSPDTMIVTVVSTIEFREIGQFSRQPNFYVNQGETHTAQVFLSDPAPAGGLGVTFVYGRPGTSTVTPSPAIIPAGQLSATVTIQGVTPARDSVVPTSGGFVGKFSYVDVAVNNLQLSIPYPQAVGVGQTIQPYVYYTYAMDHPLTVSLSLTPPRGTVPPTTAVPANTYYSYFTVTAFAPGTTYVSASASGWNGVSGPIVFTTPQLDASGTGSMVAGDPTKGSWIAYTEDSIALYQHPVADTVFVTAVSRDTSVVAVDVGTAKVRPGQSSASVANALRAQPAAGGQTTWIVLTAPGYRPDSFQVNVTAPALSYAPSYPYQVVVGGQFQNAGYVQIPYPRPDSFTVVFAHTNGSIVSGPDSVTIPKGQTYAYFDVIGNALGHDSIMIARATGYTIPQGHAFDVVPLHVTTYTQPTTLYTISRPQRVSVYAQQAVAPFYSNNLVAPLRVNLASSNPAAFTLDSAAVTIPAGAYISAVDTLRVDPASPGNDSGRVLISAAGSTNDSSAVIRVLPTPLTMYMPYPQLAGYHLKLPNAYVGIPDIAPDTVNVTLTRRLPSADSLSTFTVRIPKGQQYSSSFDFIALDSTGTDTVTATATGYVSASAGASAVPGQIDVVDIGANHLTTEPPVRVSTYLRMRPAPLYQQVPIDSVSFTIVSTDSNVIQIDSAATVSGALGSGTSIVPKDQSSGYFRVRFVGSGTARVIVSAPSYGTDTLASVNVSGPVLHLGYQNLTVGVGQVYQNQYVYVDNNVASPLVVSLSKSDSSLPAASQAFGLSVNSVTIPAGNRYSNNFDVTGQTGGSAALIARATGYGQASTPVQVGSPQLSVASTMLLHVGQVPLGVSAYTDDQNGLSRVVASPLVVSQTVSDPTVATGDSTSRTIPAGQGSTNFIFRPLQAGAVSAIFTAPGYRPDTTVITVDTAQLSFSNVPTTIGVNQTAQMYVQVPFSNESPIVVTLSTSPVGFISVPTTVTIPAGAGYVYFAVNGVSNGTAHVNGTAAIARPGSSSDIAVGSPKLQLSLSSATNVGQKSTLTVYAFDSLGTPRNPATPLAVTLVSSDPTNTVFDSATITIPVSQTYAQTGVTFNQAGSYTITGSATGYVAGNVSSTASGALVVISGSAFGPQNITINAGQTVTWRNDDAIAHTTTSDTGLWNSGNLATGNTYQRTFSTAGTFTYRCTIHTFMTGTVTVQ